MTEWTEVGDGTYTTRVGDQLWHLGMVDDGAWPAGWCVWKDGQRRARPVAAPGRDMALVFAPASRAVLVWR
jgi:hypothetical protein